MNLLSCIVVVNLSLGLLMLFDSQIRTMLTVDYGSICNMTDCYVEFTPEYNIKDPKVFYRLDQFYSNHRTFAKSKSWAQMQGEVLQNSELADCAPVLTVGDLSDWWTATELPGKINSGQQANPCGLIGKYRFSDTFIEVSQIDSSNTFQIF